MLFGATPMGRELAPRVAYACDSGPHRRLHQARDRRPRQGRPRASSAILKQTRPALGGNIMATIMTKDSPTQMATVRPGVFKVPPRDAARTGEVVRVTPDLDDGDARRSRSRRSSRSPPRSASATRRSSWPAATGSASRSDFERLPPAAGRQPRAACSVTTPRSPPRATPSRTATRPTTTRSARPARRWHPSCTSPIGISGRRPARVRDADVGHGGRDQQGSAGADLQLRGLRRRRRSRDGRPAARPRDAGRPDDGRHRHPDRRRRPRRPRRRPPGEAAGARRPAARSPSSSSTRRPPPGNHVLSGAAFEAACLDELLPGWRDMRHPFTEHLVPVERDDMYFLRARSRPTGSRRCVVPSRMHHVGDFTISLVAPRPVPRRAGREGRRRGLPRLHGARR